MCSRLDNTAAEQTDGQTDGQTISRIRAANAQWRINHGAPAQGAPKV